MWGGGGVGGGGELRREEEVEEDTLELCVKWGGGEVEKE